MPKTFSEKKEALKNFRNRKPVSNDLPATFLYFSLPSSTPQHRRQVTPIADQLVTFLLLSHPRWLELRRFTTTRETEGKRLWRGDCAVLLMIRYDGTLPHDTCRSSVVKTKFIECQNHKICGMSVFVGRYFLTPKLDSVYLKSMGWSFFEIDNFCPLLLSIYTSSLLYDLFLEFGVL